MKELRYRLIVECSNTRATYVPIFDINKDIELAFLQLSHYQLWTTLHDEDKVTDLVTKELNKSVFFAEEIDTVKCELKEFEGIPMFIITYHLNVLDDEQLKPAKLEPISPEMQERLDKTGLPF